MGGLSAATESRVQVTKSTAVFIKVFCHLKWDDLNMEPVKQFMETTAVIK